MVRQNRLLRTQTLAAPPSTRPAAASESYEGCRLRLLPHLEGVKNRCQASPRLRLPSARQASWMLLRPEKLTGEESQMVELLGRLSPAVRRAQELALSFVQLIRERRVEELREWLVKAGRSELPEFRRLAKGLTSDLSAVKAALLYQWSQGQVEGQVHRLKLIKRQMYERAKLNLLRARVLHAG